MANSYPEGVENLLKDTFSCLGLNGVYRNSAEEFSVRVLVREQESWVNAGDPVIGGSILSARITFEVRVADVPEVAVGDTIELNDRVYKVFQAPLKDPTSTIWIVEGMVMEHISQNLE
jgi:hypothetical protein